MKEELPKEACGRDENLTELSPKPRILFLMETMSLPVSAESDGTGPSAVGSECQLLTALGTDRPQLVIFSFYGK